MEKGLIFKRGGGRSRRVLDDVKQFATLVGHETKITGRLAGQDNCIVDGAVEGDCALDAVLVLGEQGQWRGNISAVNVILSGEVHGDVTVKSRLELTATARVTGCISCPAIAIAEGAVHQGEVRMAKPSEIVHFRERRKDG